MDKRSPYRRFIGTASEYTLLHNEIRALIPATDQCKYCGISDSRLELANIDQKYSRRLSSWAYMCARCHRRHDSKKYRWSNGWRKLCNSCLKEKPESDFYFRKAKQTVHGKKERQRTDSTAWCKKCTVSWGAVVHDKKRGIICLRCHKVSGQDAVRGECIFEDKETHIVRLSKRHVYNY